MLVLDVYTLFLLSTLVILLWVGVYTARVFLSRIRPTHGYYFEKIYINTICCISTACFVVRAVLTQLTLASMLVYVLMHTYTCSMQQHCLQLKHRLPVELRSSIL